jgi:hypothetical protein
VKDRILAKIQSTVRRNGMASAGRPILDNTIVSEIIPASGMPATPIHATTEMKATKIWAGRERVIP